jgi:GNAT superfamily N-acetyltransferase
MKDSKHHGVTFRVEGVAGAVAELCSMVQPHGLPDGQWFYFNRLVVNKNLRGKGHGRNLMEQVCKWADEKKFFIYNEISDYGEGLDSIPGKVKFYEKFGFEHVQDNLVIRCPRNRTKPTRAS